MKTDAKKLIDAVSELNISLRITNTLFLILIVCLFVLKYMESGS